MSRVRILGGSPLRRAALFVLLASGAGAQEPDEAAFRSQHALGESHLKAGRPALAIESLEKAHALEPADACNNYDLAQAHALAGSLERARSLAEVGAEQHGTAAWQHLLGELLDRSGDPLRANQAFQAAAHKQPTEAHLFDWGESLLRLRAYAPAERVFAESVKRFPSSARLHVGLGIAHYSRGQFAQAVASLCAAVDLDPADEKAYVFLGEMYGVSPEWASEVTRRLGELVRAHPTNALGRYHYAMSLWKGSPASGAAVDRAQVEQLLNEAVALDPGLALARFRLGVLHWENGRVEAAVEDFKQAIRTKPDLAEAHYRLGQAYLKLGRKDLAEKQLEEFRRLSPKQ